MPRRRQLAPLLGCSAFGSRKPAASRDPAADEPLADLIAPADRQDSSDQRENPERTEAMLNREPTDNAEANEPDDAIDKIDPDEPIDKIEADDAMLRKDSEESGEPDDDRSSGRMQALSQQPPSRH